MHLRMKFLEKKITFLYVLSAFCYRFAFLWFFFEYTYCSVVVTQDSFSLSVVYCECVWHCFAYLLHLSLHKHNVLSVCLPSSFVRIRHKQTVHLSKQIGSTQNELHPKWLNAVKCNEKKTNEKYFYIEKYKIYYCIRSFSCASASDNMNAEKTKKIFFKVKKWFESDLLSGEFFFLFIIPLNSQNVHCICVVFRWMADCRFVYLFAQYTKHTRQKGKNDFFGKKDKNTQWQQEEKINKSRTNEIYIKKKTTEEEKYNIKTRTQIRF